MNSTGGGDERKRAAFAARLSLSPALSREREREQEHYFFRPAALRSASALSVFSQEKAVALCFLPLPSV